ncbi:MULTISPECIES: hypothetical protein [unclassified Pantoea]|uniref:hypothetical protein n=1 Tax=unclassified Pantoea TaxID=2630326 RepID=UPI00301C34DA
MFVKAAFTQAASLEMAALFAFVRKCNLGLLGAGDPQQSTKSFQPLQGIRAPSQRRPT